MGKHKIEKCTDLIYIYIESSTDFWWEPKHNHDDVIKWKRFPRYWPFVWGIHQLIPLTKASDTELWCFL